MSAQDLDGRMKLLEKRLIWCAKYIEIIFVLIYSPMPFNNHFTVPSISDEYSKTSNRKNILYSNTVLVDSQFGRKVKHSQSMGKGV